MALSKGWAELDRATSGLGMSRPNPDNPFRYFHSSREVIRLVVLMYVRFPLSLRNFEDLLLWLPPVVQEVLIQCASDRVRSSVRPVSAALSEAAGRYGDLRIRSRSARRVQALQADRWFS